MSPGNKLLVKLLYFVIGKFVYKLNNVYPCEKKYYPQKSPSRKCMFFFKFLQAKFDV